MNREIRAIIKSYISRLKTPARTSRSRAIPDTDVARTKYRETKGVSNFLPRNRREFVAGEHPDEGQSARREKISADKARTNVCAYLRALMRIRLLCRASICSRRFRLSLGASLVSSRIDTALESRLVPSGDTRAVSRSQHEEVAHSWPQEVCPPPSFA